MDAVVLVYFLKLAVKLLLGDIRRKNHFFHFYADHCCALHGAPLVGEIVRPFAHAENAERRNCAGCPELFHILLHLRSEGVSDFFAS